MLCLNRADVCPRRSLGYCLASLLVIALLIATSGAIEAAPSAPSVSGRITDDDRPVPRATVTLKNDATNLTTETDAKGAFRFDHVPIGTYRLRASRDDLAAERDLVVRTAGRSHIELEVEPVFTTHHLDPRRPRRKPRRRLHSPRL